MVNAVKMAKGDRPNGPFYINEYRQVIVPVGSGPVYYLAGEYHRSLEFEFEGKTLTGRAVSWEGASLSPGDRWVGPHAGIPYVLAAGGNDIYFETVPRPNVTKRVMLSKHVSPAAASDIAGMIRDTKGFLGGRFYVNEWRELFAPLTRSRELEYVYVGHLDDDAPWFPKGVAGG